jgi:hypothetical protein
MFEGTVMANAVKSLWSPQIKPDVLSPRQILNVQAAALAEMTGGVLVGELLERNKDDEQVVFTLNMFAPTIKYRQQVLVARHALGLLYPVALDAEVFRPKGLLPAGNVFDRLTGKKPESQADNDEELVMLVGKVLQSSEVVSQAQSLIALSNEARALTDYIGDLRKLSDAERQSEIEKKLGATSHKILDSEPFRRASAVTNATGWGVDECHIQSVEFAEEMCLVKLSYSATDEQEGEQPGAGGKITGTATAVIDRRGVVEYREITAEVEHHTGEPKAGE